MARDPNEAPDPNFAEALQADASLGSFGELLRQVVEDSPALSGDASSDEAPGFSNTSRYSGSAHSPQGFHGPADVEQLAQHAQQEAARFQLSERERRERNKAAQAAYRQRKRAKVSSDKQELQKAADRIALLEQQISDLRSGKAALPSEGAVPQPASTEALRTEFTTLQSGQTKFHGLLADLRQAQHEGASLPQGSPQPTSFALMCELNELRELPHHSRRLARMHCIQTLHMHAGWEEALPVGLKKLYDSLLSGHLDVTVRLDYRHTNLTITLRSLLRLTGREIQAMMAEPTACLAFASKYSWDEKSPQGRRFAAMCGESACLGAMLTEVSTHHLLQNMNTHLYHSQDPATSRPQDSHLQTVQRAGNISREQQLQTKHLWTNYINDIGPLVVERTTLQQDLEASGGHQAMLHGGPARLVATALNKAADLEHNLLQQQERFLFVLSRFIFQVLSPFQTGHLSGAAYPFTLGWSELIASVARQADAPPLATDGQPQ